CIPIKINVFVWRARLDCLPSRSNLVRRGVALDSVTCPLCHAFVEDIQHVLFRCDIAQRIFRMICRWWDLVWQDLLSFSDWNTWFSSIRLPAKVKSLLEGVFCVAWWSIWVFRNRSIFGEVPPRRSVIFDEIVSFSFNWCSSRNGGDDGGGGEEVEENICGGGEEVEENIRLVEGGRREWVSKNGGDDGDGGGEEVEENICGGGEEVEENIRLG
ncbi:RNA-directed DNA polymerase, eukaryota, partial [Tanacetum coccineum]